MGVGPTALRLYERMLAEGLLRPGLSVCELGSQDFVPQNYGKLAKCTTQRSARGLYSFLGMEPYVCIDLNGEHEALRLDINEIKWSGVKFDVVTNHGTSEHIFNQHNCFQLMHDLTTPGGLMIHVVPTKGYVRHGMFNYGELLFRELVKANQYGLLLCYEEDDRSGTLMVAVLRKIIDAPFAVPIQTVYGVSVPV